MGGSRGGGTGSLDPPPLGKSQVAKGFLKNSDKKNPSEPPRQNLLNPLQYSEGTSKSVDAEIGICMTFPIF